MPARLNKRKSLNRLEEAQRLLDRGQGAEAADVVREVLEHGSVDDAAAHGLLADALSQAGQLEAQLEVLRTALHRFPREVGIEVRLGCALVDFGAVEEGVQRLERVKGRLGRDQKLMMRLAAALAVAGKDADAEAAAQSAAALGAKEEARLVLAIAKASAGALPAALALAGPLAAARRPEIATRAALLVAEVLLAQQRGPESLAAFKALESSGRLPLEVLSHVAWASELSGERAQADALSARATRTGLRADDQLHLARVALHRGELPLALARLDAVPPVGKGPWFEVESRLVRARVLRLLGRREDAWRALEDATAQREHRLAYLAGRVLAEKGHLLADGGDFAAALRAFEQALAADPLQPEAQRALAQAREKVGWRAELEQSAAAQVEEARAEADAQRRRTEAHEDELERLRAELKRVRAERADAEARAREAEDRARAAHAGAGERVREAIAVREQDADAAAKENLDRALGPALAHCPQELTTALLVAEQTFQRALLTDLPAGSVALLFSGALERALFILYVKRFDAWLDQTGRRQEFLDGAVRERRGQRVEYFDHFVEAFDSGHAGRAPSLGEVGRVLERRAEGYLAPLRDFLAQRYALSEARYEQVAAFVRWSKETLRDPVAHGRFIELGYGELRRFREQLLFSFEGAGVGLLAQMLEPRR